MAGTGYIDTNGNRHIISGMVTGERPKYTMAEYTALTNKPIDWICTDYDATSEYGINATEVKYGSGNVEQALDENIELLADCTQADTEYDLAKDLSNYKYILATSYLFSNNTTYYLMSTIMPVSNIVYNATYIICAFNDGTLRKGQLGIKSSSKIFSTPTSWTNITGIKVYGIR